MQYATVWTWAYRMSITEMSAFFTNQLICRYIRYVRNCYSIYQFNTYTEYYLYLKIILVCFYFHIKWIVLQYKICILTDISYLQDFAKFAQIQEIIAVLVIALVLWIFGFFVGSLRARNSSMLNIPLKFVSRALKSGDLSRFRRSLWSLRSVLG